MEQIFCPKCGEKNPPDAVMCWACYTALNSTANPTQNSSPNTPQNTRKNDSLWLERAQTVAVLAGLCMLVASGWLPRQFRWKSLSCGLLLFGVPITWVEYNNWFARRSKAIRKPTPNNDATDDTRYWEDDFFADADEQPIVRIANTILMYAIRDKATQIRITTWRKGVLVEYEIKGKWHEQMKIPLYVWPDLRERFKTMARVTGEQNGAFNVKMRDYSNRVTLRWENADPQETLLLQIKDLS